MTPGARIPAHGVMRKEQREAIDRRAEELAEEAPELSPEALARVKRLTNPPKTPRPNRREPRAREPRFLGDGRT